MSFGQAFGAFGNGLSSGYQVGNSAQQIRKERQEQPQTSAIDALVQRFAGAKSSEATAEQDAITEESNSRTWEMIRAMNEDNYDGGGQSSASSSSSSGGMQFDPSMIQQFTGGGSAAGGSGAAGLGGGIGGGLGGSGLMGSAGGAMSAGANGGASFGLGGSLVGGTGTVGGSTFAASSGGAAAGGAGAGGAAAGGSAGGGIAAGGPWALLAAAVISNEKYQKKKGNRSEGSKYWTDLISGNKIVERDADTLGEKIDSGNKIGLKGDWQVAGDITSFDFSNAFKGLKDTTGGKLLRGLF